MAHEGDKFVLPSSVVTPIDVGRLFRELTDVDDFLTQAWVRTPGEPVRLPKSSRELDDIAKTNKLNLLDKSDRQLLIGQFKKVRQEAPVLHMSFAAEPSAIFLQKLISWLRREVHADVLVQVGLQPSIAAGCTLRTENRYFDFSLRRHLVGKRDMLIQRLQKERKA